MNTSRPSLCKGSDTTTLGFRVRVAPHYMPDESAPEDRKFVFGYRIRIDNEGDVTATLRTRYWWIVDAHGDAHEVEGEGVVGQQPRLAPGQAFEYASFCPLRTHWGTMEGWYEFQRDDGETFRVIIGRFMLVAGA